MKNSYYKILGVVFALFIFNSSFFISNCLCQWVQVSNGMGNKDVYSLAGNGINTFVGTAGYGVYLSTNNGTSWTQTSLGNRYAKCLAINGNYIFAGTYDYGVYLSTNNGTSWTQTSLNNQFMLSLAINGNNIFAGSYGNGVYLSTNNGTSWTQTSLNSQYVYSLAVNGDNIFAAANGYGVFISTNNGSTWTQTALNAQVNSLAVNGNNIFAGTFNGVYLSTNNGTTWTQTSLGNLVVVYSLSISANNIFAGTISYNNCFYVSTNNGVNWTQRNEGLGNVTVNALLILNNYIFAGTQDSSVYRRPLSELIGIQPISEQIPSHFTLEQNYPNPFNASTVLSFQLPVSGFVSLKIYDILGREVETLVNEQIKPGTYEIEWNASNYPSGVYYYKLTTGDYTETKKMVLMK